MGWTQVLSKNTNVLPVFVCVADSVNYTRTYFIVEELFVIGIMFFPLNYQ